MSVNLNAVSNVQSSYDYYLQQYHQWQGSHPGDATGFEGWLAANGDAGVVNQWDKQLDDPSSGQTTQSQGSNLTFQRSYSNGEDTLFQTTGGQVLDFSNEGQVSALSEDQVANMFGVAGDSDPNGRAYSNMQFGNNNITFNDYSFTGTGDTTSNFTQVPLAANVNWDRQELNVSTEAGRNQVRNIINNYAESHGGQLNSFTDVFGDLQGAAYNVQYGNNSNGNPLMEVNQNGYTFNAMYNPISGAQFQFAS